MKLVDKYNWRRNAQAMSIASAVDAATDSQEYYSDPARDVRDKANATSEMLGRLIERLHTKGLFDDADVLAVLGARWKVEGAPDPAEEE